MKSFFQKSPLPFKYVLIASTALALLLASEAGALFIRTENAGFNVTGHTVLTFCKYLLWAFYVPFMYQLVIQYQTQSLGKVSKFSRLLGYSMLIAISHSIISNALYSFIIWVFSNADLATTSFQEYIAYSIPITLSRFIDIGILFGALLTIDVYRKFNEKKVQVAELESQLKNAELAAIRNQLNPHFLFNTLNTISALMDQDTEKAQDMLAKVASLLRTGLDATHKQFVTLDDEMKFIKTYLAIEQERFNDKLDIHYRINDNTLGFQVPYLILQPLVENAIKHSIAYQTEKGIIRISSEIKDQHLRLEVYDNGRGSSQTYDEMVSSGVGVKSIYERLKALYNDQASLSIETREREHFTITISIPIL